MDKMSLKEISEIMIAHLKGILTDAEALDEVFRIVRAFLNDNKGILDDEGK